jgi:hypothetical protein
MNPEQVATLIIRTANIETVDALLVKEKILDKERAELIDAGRKLLLTKSRFDLAEEFGKSIAALNDVYSESVKGGDLRTALVARKGLNRILGLYTISQTADKQVNELKETLADIFYALEVTNIDEAIETIEILKDK